MLSGLLSSSTALKLNTTPCLLSAIAYLQLYSICRGHFLHLQPVNMLCCGDTQPT
jgi:hypothetical protein